MHKLFAPKGSPGSGGQMFVSAYACDPRKGSEPGTGWAMARIAAMNFEHVYLLTREVNASEVRGSLEQLRIHNVEVIGLDGSQGWLWLKSNAPAGKYIYYIRWQQLVARKLRKITRPEDIIQHATYASDWLPSAVNFLPRRRWIWGPVGGQVKVRPSLWRYLGFRGGFSELLRLGSTGLLRSTFGVSAARAAEVVLAQNSEVATWARRFARDVRVTPNPVVPDLTPTWNGSRSSTVVGAGRLLDWKGWSIVLRALVLCPSEIKLRIFGTGRDQPRLRRLAVRLGIEHRVDFAGSVDQEALFLEIASSRCFVSASMRDSAGWSVAEALAIGAPVIGLDVAGIGTLLRISERPSVSTREKDLIRRMALAMTEPSVTRPITRWSLANQSDVFGEVFGELRSP